MHHICFSLVLTKYVLFLLLTLHTLNKLKQQNLIDVILAFQAVSDFITKSGFHYDRNIIVPSLKRMENTARSMVRCLIGVFFSEEVLATSSVFRDYSKYAELDHNIVEKCIGEYLHLRDSTTILLLQNIQINLYALLHEFTSVKSCKI